MQTIHIACSTGGEGEGERSSGALHQHDSRWYPPFLRSYCACACVRVCVCVCVRERERERGERDTQKEIDRWIERERHSYGCIRHCKYAYSVMAAWRRHRRHAHPRASSTIPSLQPQGPHMPTPYMYLHLHISIIYFLLYDVCVCIVVLVAPRPKRCLI